MAITTMSGTTISTMRPTTGDHSDAALGTLHVSSNVFQDDWTLHMLCQYIQQTTFQLNLNVIANSSKNNQSDVLFLIIGGGGGSHSASSTSASTSTTVCPTANVIRERNAIVRSLIGIALHGSFDSFYTNHQLNTSNSSFTPIGWNGGYGMMHSSCHSTSLVASTQHVKMLHYMSIASQLRNHNDMISILVEELDNALQKTSFLLPCSATPSFADIDVAVALLLAFVSSCSNLEGISELTSAYNNMFPVNVQRWMIQMIPTIQQLSNITNVPCPYHANVGIVMDAVSSLASTKLSSAPLMFFYGTEDTKQVLSQLLNASASASGPKPPPTSTTMKSPSVNAASTTNDTSTKSNDVVPAAVDGGKKKLTKQDKKAAAAAAKAAAVAGGDTAGDKEATTTTTSKKAEATTTAPASDVYDVTALDLRIGKIVKIWEHESADKLYCEEIDFGNGEVRQIASGLRPFYNDPNDLLNQLVLVVYNLKKRTLVGFPSHGMVLCASNADHTAVEIVTPPPNATIGERIAFDGLDNNKVAEPESKVAKKKIFEMIAPDLVTNDDGYVQWKTHAAQCSVGPIRAINGMSNAHVS